MLPIEVLDLSLAVVCAMNSEPLNLAPISSRLPAESRPSFAACAAATAPELPSFRADATRWLWRQLLQLVAAVSKWRERQTQRAELARLDAWTQRDLGLADAEIWRELQKRPWQP